jgi:hypothetical protein
MKSITARNLSPHNLLCFRKSLRSYFLCPLATSIYFHGITAAIVTFTSDSSSSRKPLPLFSSSSLPPETSPTCHVIPSFGRQRDRAFRRPRKSCLETYPTLPASLVREAPRYVQNGHYRIRVGLEIPASRYISVHTRR